MKHSKLARRLAILITGALIVTVVSLGGASASNLPAAPSETVSTTGSDTGNCVASPCATINYAISQAAAGETIHVLAGTYNQTVDVNKPVNIIGAGASTTTLDGTGLDPSSSGYYGIVYVDATGGFSRVAGFTITNPEPYAYTGGEPMAVALTDPNAHDAVSIVNDTITEGSADSNASTDFPIGIDSLLNAANSTIASDTISGFFQGALLEDNGPATVNATRFTKLISATDTSSGTVYPAEGLFFLADAGGTYDGLNATNNGFYGYSGYGIAEDAGYTGGYVPPGCVANGSIGSTLRGNTFALTGGTSATGIALRASGPSNSLNATVSGNHGYVTAPSSDVESQSVSVPATPPNTDCGPYSSTTGGGGALDAVENNNNLTQSAATASASASAAASTVGGLHAPNHPRRR